MRDPRAESVMLLENKPTIETLSKRHDRDSFACGVPELDAYLKGQARQDARRNVSRVFVATLDDSKTVAGFYTLSAASVEFENLPEGIARKLPRYPVPVARIGRLAVDKQYQGIGLGAYLLVDALDRVLAASDAVAMYAVIVDATSPKAKRFYQHFGFQAFRDEPLRLFIPIKTLMKLRT